VNLRGLLLRFRNQQEEKSRTDDVRPVLGTLRNMQSVSPPGVIRIRAVRLLLFGVECIRFPWVRLNAEDLCSTANRRQVGM